MSGASRPPTVWRDVTVCIAALLVVLAWDLSDADLAVARWYGGPGGFPLREAWLTRAVMHEGARWVAAIVFCMLAIDALRLRGARSCRIWRLYWFAAVIVGLLLVPTLKHYSGTSCPYDLAMFGGGSPYVSHLRPGPGDGGPARCFPSGHAVTGLAFMPLYFRWRDSRPGRARMALACVLIAGAACGWAQVARGAHFPSHVLWSAWIIWTTCCVLAALISWHRSRTGTPPASRAGSAAS